MREAFRKFRFATALAAAALLGVAGPVVAADAEALWSALAEGGKVVMIRHTATEEASSEVSMNLAEDGDCTQEQNLTDAGREQARELGQLFKEHEIGIDTVLTSEFCRARETAELAFGDYEGWGALNLTESLPSDDVEFLMEDVRERMGDFAGDGNLVLMTHRSNINTITFQQTEPGDMVVVLPDGVGGFSVLGMIPAP